MRLVSGPRVHLDHAAELRAHALARRTRCHRQGDHRGHAVACEQPGDEGGAPLEPFARECVDAGRVPVEDLHRHAARGEPARQLLGDRLHRPLLGTRHPDREGRRAHDPPAATPGKRPGRKMTFLSFTTSWSFR